MNKPEDHIYIESRLGFSEIRSRLQSECFTPVGQELALKDFFCKDVETIRKELLLTNEMKYICEYQNGVPALAFDDFRDDLLRIRIAGTMAEIPVLQSIAFIIDKLSDLRSIFSLQEEKTPLLKEMITTHVFDASLAVRIYEVIDENGEVRSTASERLSEIRKEISGQRRKIERTIQSMLKNLKDKGLVEEEVNLSIRGGRLVIPVHASKKRMVKGVVLDESATGQTVFIEPIEIFELNNDIQDLEFEEKREIVKILTALADRIRPQIQEILGHIDFLGIIDFLNGKAKLALLHNAVMPVIPEERRMTIMQGRHPVLEESLKKSGRKIVPLELELGPEHRMIIISGPNAGGKSVAMKTTGLLQYMFQCGFLVPAAEGTVLYPFDKILADIGDQQSIENDLSTYSSHLLNMKQFMEQGSKSTFVLIDEFGSGTEPESGGAIAEAVLEVLNEKGVYGVITTHYFNLKMFAANHEGVINGAMLFDNEKLKPLYRLQTGKPGSSFAIEIASSIGLPEKVISDASSRIGKGRIEMEKMIQDLENEKAKIDDRRRQLAVAEDFVSELIEKYNRLNKSIVEKRDRIIAKAENEAKNILSESNALIERTIREIKQHQAEKEKVKEIRSEFEKKASSLKKTKEKPIEPLPLKKTETQSVQPPKPLKAGDHVRLDEGSETGVVTEIKSRKVKVQFEMAVLTVDAARLSVVQIQKQKTHQTSKKVNLVSEKKETVYQLDFRGMSAIDAITELDKFLDDALLTGVRSFSILHGKGFGILRKEIRNHLRQYKDMLEFCDAPLQFGGEGITEVRFL
ncbi:Endonuclease MutS2 [bioreactor metagenome]|uniref:Endonuclease MutS2 n=1 Tax=bioreactor metagenome TaxID=1076179 RepID=A0A644WK74_9ZZZZ